MKMGYIRQRKGRWTVEIKKRRGHKIYETFTKKSYYTVKLILIPETIGAIYYIKKNESFLKKNLIAGINLTCTGLKGPYTKISSISENTYIDRIFDRIGKNYKNYTNISFLKRGSNERQFGCQNLKLPFVTFCRQRFGDYKEYHTSVDNLNIMNYFELIKSSLFIKKIIDEIQKNRIYIKKVIGEPFLQKYKLVNSISALKNMRNKNRMQISNFLAYIDQSCDLKFLSNKLKIKFSKLNFIAKILEKNKIIKKI